MTTRPENIDTALADLRAWESRVEAELAATTAPDRIAELSDVLSEIRRARDGLIACRPWRGPDDLIASFGRAFRPADMDL